MAKFRKHVSSPSLPSPGFGALTLCAHALLALRNLDKGDAPCVFKRWSVSRACRVDKQPHRPPPVSEPAFLLRWPATLAFLSLLTNPRHRLLTTLPFHPTHTTASSSFGYSELAAASRMSGKFKASKGMVWLSGVVSGDVGCGLLVRLCVSNYVFGSAALA